MKKFRAGQVAAIVDATSLNNFGAFEFGVVGVNTLAAYNSGLATLPADTFSDCVLSSDGNYAYIANGTATGVERLIRIDLTNGAKLFCQSAPVGSPRGIALSPDQTTLVVTSNASPFIELYNATTLVKQAQTGTVPSDASYFPTFSADGTKLSFGLATAPWVTRYNFPAMTPLAALADGPTSRGYRTAFSPNGGYWAVAGEAATAALRLYETTNWTRLTIPAINVATLSGGLRFSPDSTKLAWFADVTGTTTSLRILDIPTLTFKSITLPANMVGYIVDLKWLTNDVVAYISWGSSSGASSTAIYNVTTATTIARTDTEYYGLSSCRVARIHPQTVWRKIAGTVVNASNNPVSRTVNVFDRDTLALIATAQSSASDGKFSTYIYTGSPVIVLAIGTGSEVTKLADSIVGAVVS